MSLIRLTTTTAGMAAVAAALAALTPPASVLRAAVTGPQHLSDTAGPDAVVLAVAAVLAWLVWAWGALGLLLTAAGALPGWLGAAARLLTRVTLPAGARRAAALALGTGLGIAGPFAGLAAAAPAPAPTVSEVPDWPAAAAVLRPAGVPDWPAGTAGTHVVVRGECLWEIAAGSLRAAGSPSSDAQIATEAHAWWSANAAVVGPDPDLLLPGQVLHPPQENR